MSSLKSIPFNSCQVAEYERRRYRGLDQRLVHWRETRILKKWLKELALQGDNLGPCLDAPCGYGRFSRLILENGFRLISGDLSLAMVARARRRGYNNHFPIGIILNMLTGLPFIDSSFDVVLSLRFFHHLHSSRERLTVLTEIARVTKRWAIVSFYKKQALHIWQRRFRRIVKPSPTKISMVSLVTFKQEVAAAGFCLRKLTPLCPGLHAQHFALLEKK
ncbi:MAG: class I SAM-dependent methyltransferase [Candidatus Aminicenantes bacterium]|nr:class I SAM-dependent methyltransferase [Candidatus Aminicenantes bacterium]